MKVAVTVWEGAVSTVCDFCSQLLIFDIEVRAAKNPLSLTFDTQWWPARVNRLKLLGVDVLLCGALSRPLERLLAAADIKVIAWLCGPVEEIVRAYEEGTLFSAGFALPGCARGGPGPRGQKRRFGIHPAPYGGKGAPKHDPRGQGSSISEKGVVMKVAVTARGKELDSPVDRVFGRARWFLIVDPQGGSVEALENSQNVNAAQGAGIQSAQQITEKSVDVVLTGNVGPNAFRALGAAAVRVFQFENDVSTVRDALTAWKEGRLQEVQAPTAKGHGF
jgi:predicted Fe-Mo cluster-binding NifX family protein